MLEVNIEKILPVTEARDKFNQIVDGVENSDDLYVLTKNGKPAAVIVGVHHLEKLTGIDHKELMDEAEESADTQTTEINQENVVKDTPDTSTSNQNTDSNITYDGVTNNMVEEVKENGQTDTTEVPNADSGNTISNNPSPAYPADSDQDSNTNNNDFAFPDLDTPANNDSAAPTPITNNTPTPASKVNNISNPTDPMSTNNNTTSVPEPSTPNITSSTPPVTQDPMQASDPANNNTTNNLNG